jgi:hypothetical protein
MTDVVSAVPVEVLQRLLQDNPALLEMLLAIDSQIPRVMKLETEPLSALDLHLTRRVDGIPPGHFLLRRSPYDITGVNLTTLWDDYANDPDHPTVIQLIAGDTASIRALAPDEFVRALVDEVSRYLPLTWDIVDLDHTMAMTHIEEPLFMNNVGSNSRRVDPLDTGLENVFIAGDHANTPVDLASMEGAIVSALKVAQEIGSRRDRPIRGPMELRSVSKWFLRVWKVVRYPVALAAWPLRVTDLYYWRQSRRLRPPDDAVAGGDGAPRR